MPITGSGAFVDPQDLLPLLPGSTLGSASIDLTLVKGRVKAAFPVDAGTDLTFVVQPGAEVSLLALNQSRPADPDQVITVSNETDAWLKYGVTAQVEASVAAEAGWFGLEAAGSRAVTCADYRRHDKDVVAAAAVLADLRRGPRFALSLQDVLALDVGDAVSLKVAGDLVARVTLSWSDVFTSQLGALTRALQNTVPIGVKASAGATVTASVSVADEFVLVFSRLDATRWRVGVKKARSNAFSIAAEGGVTVEPADTDEIARVLNDRLVEVVGTVADRSVVKSGIERLLEQKVSLAFAYEYRRISTDALLFQALLTQPPLERHHARLARGVIADVIGDALAQPPSDAPQIDVEEYLKERSVRTSRAWGFTLGFRNWEVTGQDRRELTAIRRFTLDEQHEQRSYAGFASYTGDVFGEKKIWHVDFVAEMPGFSTATSPQVNDYQLGLQLSMEETNRRFDEDDLEQALDAAVLWGICAPREAGAVRAMLEPLVGRKNVEWSVHLRLSDGLLRAASPVLAAGGRVQFAGAMAAAMRARRKVGGIVDVARRRAVYEPVWAFYLDAQQEPAPEDVSRAAVRHLRTQEPSAVFAEERFMQFDRLLTAAGTCDLNPRTRSDVDSFLRGARTLADGIAANAADRDLLGSVYKSMVPLWTQSHHVRALGVRLLDVARQIGRLEDVERTLTATEHGDSITISSNPAG
jgi:hypothetical protein